MINRYKKNITIAAFLIYIISIFLYQQNEDTVMLFMMSLLFSGGIFGLLSSIDYLFFKNKFSAQITDRNMNDGGTGVSGSGSFSSGYRYSFLINSHIYQMPPFIHFGSKYEIDESINVVIINKEKHYALPIRLVYNILFVSIMALLSSL